MKKIWPEGAMAESQFEAKEAAALVGIAFRRPSIFPSSRVATAYERRGGI